MAEIRKQILGFSFVPQTIPDPFIAIGQILNICRDQSYWEESKYQYKKIGAIKALREQHPGLGLKDAKEMIEYGLDYLTNRGSYYDSGIIEG